MLKKKKFLQIIFKKAYYPTNITSNVSFTMDNNK